MHPCVCKELHASSTYNFQSTNSIQNIQWIETLANKKHTCIPQVNYIIMITSIDIRSLLQNFKYVKTKV